jgi:hypothetical protein
MLIISTYLTFHRSHKLCYKDNEYYTLHARSLIFVFCYINTMLKGVLNKHYKLYICFRVH